MLGRARKGFEVLTPQRQEDAPPPSFAECLDGVLNVIDFSPAVTCHEGPGRATDRQQGYSRLSGSAHCVGGNSGRIGMSCVDQPIDPGRAKILDQSLDSSEPSAASGYGLRGRRRRASGKGQSHGNLPTNRKPPGEIARLGGPSQDQDVSRHV
jgi:hypothetical protein